MYIFVTSIEIIIYGNRFKHLLLLYTVFIVQNVLNIADKYFYVSKQRQKINNKTIVVQSSDKSASSIQFMFDIFFCPNFVDKKIINKMEIWCKLIGNDLYQLHRKSKLEIFFIQ